MIKRKHKKKKNFGVLNPSKCPSLDRPNTQDTTRLIEDSCQSVQNNSISEFLVTVVKIEEVAMQFLPHLIKHRKNDLSN